MEYSFSQLSNIAKSLRERYPIGTRIKLISMGDDPHPIPPGTKGTVEGIDDIATVFCRFDNGRSLGLAYGEDHYRALTQAELLEEKCARNYDKYYEAVHRDIFADVDLDRFAEEIENANDNYTTEILGQLHDKFVEIYDTDSVDSLVGFIQVPAIVESLQTGDYYPALVTLDLDSSGEHWGYVHYDTDRCNRPRCNGRDRGRKSLHAESGAVPILVHSKLRERHPCGYGRVSRRHLGYHLRSHRTDV